jgi:hypothetical protein
MLHIKPLVDDYFKDMAPGVQVRPERRALIHALFAFAYSDTIPVDASATTREALVDLLSGILAHTDDECLLLTVEDCGAVLTSDAYPTDDCPVCGETCDEETGKMRCTCGSNLVTEMDKTRGDNNRLRTALEMLGSRLEGKALSLDDTAALTVFIAATLAKTT